jgi:hypothetical protein
MFKVRPIRERLERALQMTGARIDRRDAYVEIMRGSRRSSESHVRSCADWSQHGATYTD